jgi:sugar phosphate isomerase/epimerase
MDHRLGLADFTYMLTKWRVKRIEDPQIVARCAEWGLSACQVDLYLKDPDGGAAKRAASRDAGTHYGIELIGACYAPPVTEQFEKAIRAGLELNARIVRFACGPMFLIQPQIPLAELAAQIRPAITLAERENVKLVLENHQDYTSRELLQLIDMVGSPNLGVCLDTGNSIALGEDPVETCTLLAPHAPMVHLKEYIVLPNAQGGINLIGVPLGKGAIDQQAVVAAIKANARCGVRFLVENPLECCPINLLDPRYGQRFPNFNLGPIAALVEKSKKLYPNGVTLPQQTNLGDDVIVAVEEAHNRQAAIYARKELAL